MVGLNIGLVLFSINSVSYKVLIQGIMTYDPNYHIRLLGILTDEIKLSELEIF